MKKKSIIIITAIIISLSSSGQQYAPYLVGGYTVNPLLDRFVGTWLWTSATDTMKLVLQKQVVHFPSPCNCDVDKLVGWHRYVKNGVQIESNLQNVGQPFSTNLFSLFGGKTSLNQQRLQFKDITKSKTRNEVYFTLPRNSNQATWQLSNSPGVRVRINNESAYDWSFTVPTNMVFTKQ